MGQKGEPPFLGKHPKIRDMKRLRLDASKTRRFCPSDYSEGEQLRFPPSDGRLDSIEAPCLPFSGLRPATEGTDPLGSPKLICGEPQTSQMRLGFRLRSPLSSVEEPCPLSLQTVFSAPSLSHNLASIMGKRCFPFIEKSSLSLLFKV
jgi:hypothetical protein